MSNPMIRTAVGDIAPSEAQRALTHEHFAMVRTELPDPGRFLRRAVARIDRDTAALAKTGCNLMTDLSPIGYLRSGDLYRRIFRRTGIRVVASTGTYAEAWVPPWFARLGLAEMTRIMRREIEEGIEGQGVRAGIIKVASSRRDVTGLARRIFRAAVAVHRRTGVPIICHSHPGIAAHVAFFKEQKVDPDRVALSHVEANTWLEARAAARAGFMLCFTNIGSEWIVPDEVILAHVAALARQGHERRIMISADFRYRVPDGVVREVWRTNRYDYVFRSFIPRLRKLGVPARKIERIVEDNPRRFLAFRSPP